MHCEIHWCFLHCAGAALVGVRDKFAPEGLRVAATLEPRKQDNPAKIDIVFIDLVLPFCMSGAVLAEEGKRRRSGAPVFFTPGRRRNAIVHDGVLDPDAHLVSTPDTAANVRKKQRQISDMALVTKPASDSA